MKDLVENSMVFAIAFLALYILIDIADARWFIPRMRDKCKGAMTEQQEEVCYHWIYLKGKPNEHIP